MLYVTTEGKYCKLNKHNYLVIARDYSEAVLFPRQDAEARIGKGRKSHFYRIEAATLPPVGVAELSAQNCDIRENTATMFDRCHYDWEGMLSDLCYISQHMTEYQTKLYGMQSDVDREISDIMHYLEFNNPGTDEMLKASQMLQERRRKRREITDEIEKTNLIRDTVFDRDFEIKIQQALGRMERMKARQYTPRKLTDLFTQNQKASA